MLKEKINSDSFAKRIGAYSHGYKVDLGNAYMIFTTGQIAIDENGHVLYQDDVAEQTKFVFERLDDIFRAVGGTLDDVVKVTIYVTEMSDFPKISAVRNEYLKDSEPVSTFVEVDGFVKDGCQVEIEAIAVIAK